MNNVRLIAMLLITLFVLNANAQKFGGGLILGFNASQIDGDELAGYDKMGISTGLNTSYDISDPWQVNIEFLYSQRGSQSQLIADKYSEIRKITLNYLELPLYISYQDWLIDEEYYKVQLFAGLSLGRLFSVKNALGESDYNEDNFLKNDLSYLVGAKFMFNKHVGIQGRYTRAFTRLYMNPDDGSKSLLSYFLNFGLFYKFL